MLLNEEHMFWHHASAVLLSLGTVFANVSVLRRHWDFVRAQLLFWIETHLSGVEMLWFLDLLWSDVDCLCGNDVVLRVVFAQEFRLDLEKRCIMWCETGRMLRIPDRVMSTLKQQPEIAS